MSHRPSQNFSSFTPANEWIGDHVLTKCRNDSIVSNHLSEQPVLRPLGILGP